MPSGKRRLDSVCGRHHDDRKRNSSDVFRRGIRILLSFPIFTDLYRHLTEIVEVHYTPVTLNIAFLLDILALLFIYQNLFTIVIQTIKIH